MNFRKLYALFKEYCKFYGLKIPEEYADIDDVIPY